MKVNGPLIGQISGMVVVVIGIVALWTAPSTKSDMSPTAYKQKKTQRTFHIAAGASCIAGGSVLAFACMFALDFNDRFNARHNGRVSKITG